jgi:hypothetical protein
MEDEGETKRMTATINTVIINYHPAATTRTSALKGKRIESMISVFTEQISKDVPSIAKYII